MKLHILPALCLFAGLPALSQIDSGTKHLVTHNAAELAQHEAKLLEKAKAAPNGLGMEPLDEFGNARTLLVVRTKTGDAERHQAWADQIVMLKGSATLVIGKEMRGEHPNGTQAGESLAASIDSAKEVVLKPGDIAHVPPGMPHWVKIAPGTTATYLVFKEK